MELTHEEAMDLVNLMIDEIKKECDDSTHNLHQQIYEVMFLKWAYIGFRTNFWGKLDNGER